MVQWTGEQLCNWVEIVQWTGEQLFRYVQIFVTYARDGRINPKWVFVENFVAFVGVSRNVTAPLNVSETLRYQMSCNSIHCSPVTAGQIRSMATVTVSVVTFHANAPQIMEPRYWGHMSDVTWFSFLHTPARSRCKALAPLPCPPDGTALNYVRRQMTLAV